MPVSQKNTIFVFTKLSMNILPPNNLNFYKGFFLTILIASIATFLAELAFFKDLAFSPLIVGILLGMIFANTLRSYMPKEWAPGIIYCTKIVLRTAIIFYGFRITFQQIAGVGTVGLLADIIMLSTTFLLGSFIGIKYLKIDKETAYMCSSGAAICGAAAVLATEPVVKADNSKTAVSVATVVVFGTIAMFLYPILYKSGIFMFSASQMGIYIGASVHEVAHVVGAGNAISSDTADTAVIVKMTRVMLLVPLLLALSFYLNRSNASSEGNKLSVPWFAIGFVIVAGFNSLNLLDKTIVDGINSFDKFLLTMAMTALGMETTAAKFKNIGGKPFILAFILFLWLIVGGWFTTYLLTN